MSVLKANRKESRFEVIHNAYEIRSKITDLALRDFGLKEHDEKPLPETFHQWDVRQQEGYVRSILRQRKKREGFAEWFIPDERQTIIHLIRDMVHEIFLANCINPRIIAECDERRIHQDLALGYCENIIQELQYLSTTLPVHLNQYEEITKLLVKEQELLKGWRKLDNKIRVAILKKNKDN